MASHKTVSASLQDDRGTWVVRGRVYDADTGKTQQRSKSTKLSVKGNNKRKAELMMRDIIKQWENELNGIVVSSGPLFSMYVTKWLERKRVLRIKENTLKSYEDYNKTHILPKLGNIPISLMTLQDLEGFYSEYLKTHTVNSARKVNCVISGAFREAIRDGVIQVNLADNNHLEFPKEKKFEGASYTAEEVSSLMVAAKEAGEPIKAAVMLGVLYGLRRSEVLGLRWKDIDFNCATLTVSNTVVANGELWIEAETTKTPKSHRTIALYPNTIPYLQELKQAQEQAGLKLDKVCAWPNGERVRPDYITRKTKQIMEKSGLRVIRFHDLRHTAASLAASVLSPQQVKELLGHDDIGTTFGTYAHIMDKQRRETADAMNAIIENAGIMF